MLRYGELSKNQEPSWPHQFCSDCIIATRGYDFREGHLISTHLIRVEVHPDHLAVELKAPTQRLQADGREPQPTSVSKPRTGAAPKNDRRPARHGSHGKQQDANDIDHAV